MRNPGVIFDQNLSFDRFSMLKVTLVVAFLGLRLYMLRYISPLCSKTAGLLVVPRVSQSRMGGIMASSRATNELKERYVFLKEM